MKREARSLDREVEAVIERGRQVPQVPDVVRARLMARARAAFATSKASPALVLAPAIPAQWRGRRAAVAASVLLVFATAGAAAAFHARFAATPEIAPAPPRIPEAPAVHAAAPDLLAVRPPEPVSATRAQRARRSVTLTPQESYAAELDLLQRAQSEYASRDFADALVLVAEHGRRFPNGRLAEEREALRVRSLARAGRGDEARRALASFAKRFPHSVLLPRLQEAARSAEE